MSTFQFLSPVSLADDSESAVSEVQIAEVGKWKHPTYGNLAISAKDLDEMERNFNDGKRDVHIDYHHASNDPGKDPEKAKASGWLKSLMRRGDKLFGLVEWTKAAAEYIRNKEYRYFSPTFAPDYKDKTTGKNIGTRLLSGALTNTPFLEGMAPVALAEGMEMPVYTREKDQPDPASTRKTGGENDMELTEKAQKHIRTVLKLAETVEITPEHVDQAIEQVSAEVVQLTEDLDKATDPQENLSGGEEVKELAEKVVSLEERANKAEKALAERDVNDAVSAALAAHKITPAEKPWAQKYALSDLDGFREMVEARPALDERLFSEQGSGQTNEGDPAELVRATVDAQVKEGKSLTEAQQVALKEHGAEAFAEYRKAPKAA